MWPNLENLNRFLPATKSQDRLLLDLRMRDGGLGVLPPSQTNPAHFLQYLNLP